ncbi:DUF4258 domain-containing protein [Candidatus Poribacteria bacterium]|nr:DUF4258 domain-containing protein [Candidatus Poribacteria bacterium]
MRQRVREKIRECIRNGKYEMTYHASDEMAEDKLRVVDIETSILTGQITKIEKGDPRGSKYTIEGFATYHKTRVGTVGRFTVTGKYRIITTYEIKPQEEQ